jgi:hypothetical protein
MDLYLPGIQNFVAALIPMILGMVWFHPKVFGNAWMKGANLKPEDGQGANMPLLMGVGFVMALIISSFLKSYAIFHEGTPADSTFAHGAFHGVLLGAMLGIPTLVSATIWERKSLTYYIIQIAYWLVTFALMGGLMFAWRSGYADIFKAMGEHQ